MQTAKAERGTWELKGGQKNRLSAHAVCEPGNSSGSLMFEHWGKGKQISGLMEMFHQQAPVLGGTVAPGLAASARSGLVLEMPVPRPHSPPAKQF